MKRRHVLGLLVLAGLLSFGWSLSAQPLKGCVLDLGHALEIQPADQFVYQGDTLTVSLEGFAKYGNWRVFLRFLSDTLGFVAENAFDWQIEENSGQMMVARVRVSDAVAPGTYAIRVVVTGQGQQCTGENFKTEIYPFALTVAVPAGAVSLDDARDDLFSAGSGGAVAATGLGAVDIQAFSARRTETQLSFNFTMGARLPEASEDAPMQLGCYLDTDGDAAFGAPFAPTGFDFLFLASWVPGESFAQLIRLSDGGQISGASAATDLSRLHAEVSLAAIGSPDAVGWVCFARQAGEGDAVDLVPNQGIGTL